MPTKCATRTKKHIEISMPAVFQEIWKPARYKVFYGGRGSGKTYAVTAFLIIRSLQEKITVLCTREIQESMRDSVHKVLREHINKFGLDDYFTVTDNKITNIKGSEFVFRGLRTNINSLKSFEGANYVWVEEAQSISRNSLDILVPTIRREGSELIFTFNPENETDPVYQDFVVNGRAGAIVKKVTYADNPFFPKVSEEERLAKLEDDEDEYEWIWEGELRHISDAQIFKGKFALEEFETPATARFYHGMDFGFAEDPTVLIRCFIEKSGNVLYIDREHWGKHVELTELKAFVEEIPSVKTGWRIYADNAEPAEISMLQRAGINIRNAKKGQGSVGAGIIYLRSFRKIIIHPRCMHTAEEFKKYSYKQDKQTNEILPVPVDKFNHCIDAIRYSLCKQIKRGMEW